MLAVLGHRGADARGGDARPRPRRPAAHPPRRDARRGHLLPVTLRLLARGVRRRPRLARRRRLAGALRARRRAGGQRFAASGTAVAHCPTSNARLGAGLAPVAALLEAGVAVGLGVDGSASNEESSLAAELHAAVLVARLRGGPTAMTAREALALGTIGGARVIGRADELGSLEVGKLADVARVARRRAGARRLRGPGGRAGARLAPTAGAAVVDGGTVVEDDVLLSADEHALAARAPPPRGPAGPEPAMTDHPARPHRARPAVQGGIGDERRPTRRQAEGARRVRVLLRPLDGRDALGRDPAQPARARPDRWHPHRGALAVPGVFAVLTHEDVPGTNAYGLEHRDQPVLAHDRVRYQGEPVALVAADHPETARRAAALVEVAYEELPPVTDPRAAVTRRGRVAAPGRQLRAARADPPRRPDATRRVVVHRRLRGRHAGPGVPGPGVRAGGARRRRRRRPLRRHPVAARRPQPGRLRARPRRGAGPHHAGRGRRRVRRP